ncbi:PTS sugar transporter subunit IIC [Clostridium chauvoei]|uniref:PTS sugar transporter subunit IIC n=1 Tax=Clostridium chauvoei TaxID=46867 RepID=UPI000BB7521B|nr:PTS sugar transporter subunit IIC [Clostridium chauvoei]ATD58444.1 PTS cellobiose transporter subunit IIC [Clostridium chauvoei]MBX7379736.1 PTS sugar transporter subunit IIC [Clostridium chauvoei]MBX7384782.1 PTS sugar transporter subunit IIC [Clostridium chauvoei]MBX7397372.1 PTS sugar transporter subunit IIC [Clostridium chauvoei]MBX7399887.1 PTS sugar transporter subunit IIC [Clostridium chauvoei]
MQKLNVFLEEKMFPIAAKLGSNKILISIRDGITLNMPLIIIGSLFLVIASFPIKAWTDWLTAVGIDSYLWKGVDSSFGLMGLIASFGVANSLARQYKVDGVSAGIISLSSFIVVTPFVSGEAGAGIPVGYMGSKGLFVAMVLGIISALIFKEFIKKDIQIKLPESVPPAVARSFSALIPGAAIITLWLIVFAVLDRMSIGNIHDLLLKILGGPLGLLGNNIFGTVISILLNSLFWFVGIHGGNVVNSILNPIWLMNSDANRLIFQADSAAQLPHIITQQFMDNFVYMGGGGATIGLVIVIAIIARRNRASQITKTMAPLTFTPGIFNINEPAMFGLPIVMNVSLIIPFILAPIANAVISYAAMATGLVATTTGIAVSWTMPPIISGFLTTGGHISGSILQLVCILVDVAIYWFFYKTVEKQNLELESIEK